MPLKQVKKRLSQRFRCDEIEGERFHAQPEDVFRYNWWEVFCFPYILLSRLWEFCVSLCAGTNQCMVYWMVIQWLVCKLTKITTPDPIIFPYYFYMFCQVILLTMFFVFLWIWFGKTVVIPFFVAFWEALTEDLDNPQKKNVTMLSFRRYCFRKSEIFETPTDAGSRITPSYSTYVMVFFVDLFMVNVLYR